MPALGISIHRWRRCSERAQHCFPSNLFCTINGFYISPSNCRDLGNLTSYPLPSSNHRASLTKQYPEPKLAAFITEVQDQMAGFAYSLEEQNRLLHCQLERSLGIIANTVGRLFPTGPVLSRFDRFHQIGPRALKGPRASGSGCPFLYYEVQNNMKSHKLNPFISAFS